MYWHKGSRSEGKIASSRKWKVRCIFVPFIAVSFKRLGYNVLWKKGKSTTNQKLQEKAHHNNGQELVE